MLGSGAKWRQATLPASQQSTATLQAHPGLSLDPHLASTSANFQAYVRRGLSRVAESRQSQADRPGALVHVLLNSDELVPAWTCTVRTRPPQLNICHSSLL